MTFPVSGVNAHLIGLDLSTQTDRYWVSKKMRPTQFGDNKNNPGVEYPSKITEANQKNYQPPYEDENGKTWLYNPKTKQWDIPAPTREERQEVGIKAAYGGEERTVDLTEGELGAGSEPPATA